MKLVVKLFPEITIKSRPVRRRFIKQLRNNIKLLLRRIDADVLVEGEWDSIEVNTALEDRQSLEQMLKTLCNMPGIHALLKVQKYPLGDFDDILAKTKQVVAQKLVDKTFCVRCKRSGKHSFNSTDVERYVGGGLNQQCKVKGVKLKNPDITVRLEIRQDELFIIEQSYAGLGGFPIGTQDSVLSLISGGFDSSVASYLSIRRGLQTHYCFFKLGGKAHEIAVKEVALYLWMKYGASHRVKFFSVPFEGVVEEILTKVDNSQMGVVLKRMMLRAASKVAEELKIQALVTGEAVAQVSSQTLPNLAVIDSVTDTLVLRPLIMADKQDIIDLARRIGTEEFSKNIPEYCGVISVKPTTRARADRIEREEQRFNFEVLEKAVAERQGQLIDQIVLDTEVQQATVEVTSEPAENSVVIDIRHPEEEEMRPLVLERVLERVLEGVLERVLERVPEKVPEKVPANVEIQKIPFYQLNTALPGMDPAKHYLLYCEKGIMSQLHAAYLQDEGYSNIGVLRF